MGKRSDLACFVREMTQSQRAPGAAEVSILIKFAVLTYILRWRGPIYEAKYFADIQPCLESFHPGLITEIDICTHVIVLNHSFVFGQPMAGVYI